MKRLVPPKASSPAVRSVVDSGDHRERQGRGPTLGPIGQRRHLFLRCIEAEGTDQAGGLTDIHRQRGGSDLVDAALGTHPGRGASELVTGRDHHRGSRRKNRRARRGWHRGFVSPRSSGRRPRSATPAAVAQKSGHRRECVMDVNQDRLRIAVVVRASHPCRRTRVDLRHPRQHRGLAIARRCRDHHQRTRRGGERPDEVRAWDGICPGNGGCEEVIVKSDGRLRVRPFPWTLTDCVLAMMPGTLSDPDERRRSISDARFTLSGMMWSETPVVKVLQDTVGSPIWAAS